MKTEVEDLRVRGKKCKGLAADWMGRVKGCVVGVSVYMAINEKPGVGVGREKKVTFLGIKRVSMLQAKRFQAQQ